MDLLKTCVVPRLLYTGVFFSLYIFLIPAGHFELSLVISIVGLIIYCAFMFTYYKFPAHRPLLPMFSCITMWGQLFITSTYRQDVAYNELLGWVLIFQFFTVCTVPRNRFSLILCSIIPVIYIGLQFINCWGMGDSFSKDFFNQMLVNLTLIGVVTFIAISAYRTWNQKLSALFNQVTHTLSLKKAIDKQAMEEERLVLSVLPEHVAVQMRDNLGRIDKQFKKIYMSRHENVSILYADIVGFTAISSTYSAQDLVAILNELFARFDRLAEKYEQLRIKILGDCYYCISGAPVERDDHAALCVYMGLSMVKAIKYVQQTTNSPVDMRVGIHTGAVLAGVLGQRQWQFDVYSRDVELANKMESSGMAGRVHISEVTLSYLNGEFEVEPAYGERREEMLRQAGIKTYFITNVLKPHDKDGTDDVDMATEDNSTKDEEDEERSKGQPLLNSVETSGRGYTNEEFDNLYNNLDIAEMNKRKYFSFKNIYLEAEYADDFAPTPVIATYLPFLLMPAFLALSTFIVPVAYTLLFFFLSFSFSLVCNCYWRFFAPTKVNVPASMTAFVLFFVISFLVLTDFSTLIACGIYGISAKKIYINATIDEPYMETPRCYYSNYYYHIGVVAYCATFWIPARFRVISGLVVGIWLFNTIPEIALTLYTMPSQSDFDQHYLQNFRNTSQARFFNTWDIGKDVMMMEIILHDSRHNVMLAFIAAAFLSFMQLYEWEDRTRYCRHRMLVLESRCFKEKTNRNQAMVNNVLPPHVAKHFMGGQHNHRDLYSQSYSEVGVLFASMPNFTEFYSEESVNNQGLECLRFLNEVISDFDMLLDEGRFRNDIVKIKTISSTYMAASGLGPKDKLTTSDSVIVKWEHLSRLVVFALELQRTLAAINEQSFNHFVLRLGINHGPITAGVIGARKPHYDIWGNTVNVASRMESTGKAGCIQVTSETAKILREFGYQFEQRGLVAVKGKGELMTYYLLDKEKPPLPRPVDRQPVTGHPTTLETVVQEIVDHPIVYYSKGYSV